jgi:hypothetical protein
MRLRSKLLAVLLLLGCSPLLELAVAQIGYPGGYPPGGYPGQSGGGLPFPWPRKRSKTGSGKDTQDQKTVNESGKITKIDKDSVVVAASGGRIVEVRIGKATKFFKDGKEAKSSDLKAGDYVNIEAVEDREGMLTARSVTLAEEPPAAAGPKGSGGDIETAGGPSKPSPRARDDEDGGPPVLRRGPPSAKRESDREEAKEKEEAAASAQSAGTTGAADRGPDPLLEKARMAASEFTEGLPNFTCREFMARYQSETRPADWRSLDVISTDLVYENGKESYRNVTIGSRPTNKKLEEIGGSWSTGEFATALVDLFSPSTRANFYFRRTGKAAGREARVYEFQVSQPNSHWRVTVAAQTLNPAYQGSIWIDTATARVLRIETQAREIPKEFPTDAVESAIDYDMVRIGTRDALLPVHAENLSCQRGSSYCSRNVIDFRNYHKYEAESDIKFEPVKQ